MQKVLLAAVILCVNVSERMMAQDVTIVDETPRLRAIADDQVYRATGALPSFPGGAVAMFQFLADNLRYPESAVEDNIQGQVVLKFEIGRDGSVNDVEVIRRLDPALDAEAVRVVRMFPKFQIDGCNLSENVWLTLPIRFRLNSETK